MIGKLKGIVEHIDEDSFIIDVAGVGYIVNCTTNLTSNITLGKSIEVFTHMHVREDNISLFGFESQPEKEWFLTLQSVQGVGAKMALAVLSAMSPDEILSSIYAEDTAAFKRVSGVGPKLALRIVNELKSKKKITTFGPSSLPTQRPSNHEHSVLADAVSALTNLGFDRRQVFVKVSQILESDPHMPLDEVITLTLQTIHN